MNTPDVKYARALTVDDLEVAKAVANAMIEAAGPQQVRMTMLEKMGGRNLRTFLADIEHDIIVEALHRTGGNHMHAARILGINRTTLVMKAKKLGLYLLKPDRYRAYGGTE